MTVLPRETWPSPPMTTLPWRRTETIVVTRSSCWLFRKCSTTDALSLSLIWGRCGTNSSGRSSKDRRPAGRRWKDSANAALLAQQVAEAVAGQGALGLGQSRLGGEGAERNPVPDLAVGQLGVLEPGIQPHQDDLRTHPVCLAALAEGARLEKIQGGGGCRLFRPACRRLRGRRWRRGWLGTTTGGHHFRFRPQSVEIVARAPAPGSPRLGGRRGDHSVPLAAVLPRFQGKQEGDEQADHGHATGDQPYRHPRAGFRTGPAGAAAGGFTCFGHAGYMRSRVVIPSRLRPCCRVRPVSAARRSRLSRWAGCSAARIGQFS